MDITSSIKSGLPNAKVNNNPKFTFTPIKTKKEEDTKRFLGYCFPCYQNEDCREASLPIFGLSFSDR